MELSVSGGALTLSVSKSLYHGFFYYLDFYSVIYYFFLHSACKNIFPQNALRFIAQIELCKTLTLVFLSFSRQLSSLFNIDFFPPSVFM